MRTMNFVFAWMIMLSGQGLFAQKVEVDTKGSSIDWMGKKLGREHGGNIRVKSGNIEFRDDQIVSGTIVVDMTTITNTDLKDEGPNQRLVGHLKSDDFFGVEKYPEASFVVTESSAFTGGKAIVTGDITIKGHTERISFEVERRGKEYSAKTAIDRSKFDVRYGSNSFLDNLGDSAIDDIFTLSIKVMLNES